MSGTNIQELRQYTFPHALRLCQGLEAYVINFDLNLAQGQLSSAKNTAGQLAGAL